MEDRGKIEPFLDLRVSQIEDCISVDQEMFTQIVLRRFGMDIS